MKKTINLVLALLMLTGLLVSCSSAATQAPEKDPTPAVTQTTPAEETKSSTVESQPSETPTSEAPASEKEPTAEMSTEEEIDGDPAPDFTVKLTNGENFTLSDYKDKVVFLNFWATWCPPCVGELPDIQKMYDDNTDGLVIIAVNCSEQKETVVNFVRQNRYTFNVGLDPKGEVGSLYPTDGIPYTLIIYKGKIVKTYLGAPSNPYYEYKKVILQYLNKKK